MPLAALTSFFQQHPASVYWLAYSGGLDSHVLLYACAQIRQQQPTLNFHAIHIDHGLQAVSSAWAQHCQTVCDTLHIPLKCIELQLSIPDGESLEAVARTARYQAFAQCVGEGEYLLTAHHQDDQAETLLLNLLRGSGVAGLAAMPVKRVLGKGYLARPLLNLPHAQLSRYAQQYHLNYIDDPSNAHVKFDRNYLRHVVMPVLNERWNATSANIARAAQWQAEQLELTELLLAQRLPQVIGTQAHTLSVKQLLAQPLILQKQLIRHWLKQQGFTMPSAAKLQQIIASVLLAKGDANPCVTWRGCEIRRYQDDVYALKPYRLDKTQVWTWDDLTQPLLLGEQGTLDPAVLAELLPHLTQKKLSVRFRQGGERVLRYRLHSLELKNVLQELGLPPWERERVPLIYHGEQLIAVGTYWRTKPQWLLP